MHMQGKLLALRNVVHICTLLERKAEDANVMVHDRIAEAFIALQLTGAAGLTLLLLTALVGTNVKRYSTWYSFIGSWIFSALCYTLLGMAGQQMGPPPDFNLCVVQSALIYAAPTLTACTTLSLIVHMLLNVRRALANTPFKTGWARVLLLLVVPYVIWTASFLGTLLYALSNPDTVRRSPNNTYCDSTNPMLSKISSMIVLPCMVLIIVIQGIIGYKLYQKRHVITKCSQTITMMIRVMVFSLLGALALGLAVAYVLTWQHDQAFDMILATMPVLAFLVFGSQMDLVEVWMFWRDKSSARSFVSTHTKYSSVSTRDSLL